MGILLALTALFSWGLGDFLIEKSTRKFGDWIALFYICAFGAIVLSPFVYREIGQAFNEHFVLLFVTGIFILIAALFNFEALRIGKISVIEPIFSFEIIVVVLLSLFVINEKISFPQMILIAISMMGIVLVSTKSFSHLREIKMEKGTWYAIFGAICMGTATFLYGLGSRETSPLMINWFNNVFITVACLFYLVFNSKLKEVAQDFRNNKRLIFNVSFFDNLAWIVYSFSTLYIPIAVATAISEGFIAFASFLGLVFNKEKLRYHQVLGFVISFVSIVLLSIITSK